MLSKSGSGLSKRLIESLSIGPMRMRDRVVLLIGFKIVEVASLYRFMGEKEDVILRTSSCLMIASALAPAV